MQANVVAVFALLSWPCVAAYLYATQPIARATVLTVLGGYLLLPTGAAIKFDMIPAFDKDSIPGLCALCGCLLMAPHKPKLFAGRLTGPLILAFLLSPLVTSLLNGDDIFVGDRVLPGVGSYDGLSAVISQFLGFIPFVLGRQYFRTSADIQEILRITIVAALLYSLPMLFEIRMSPQLANWIYGYFPSSFPTEVRYGGYRPVVFVENGLILAFFFMTAVVSAMAFWRANVRVWTLPPTAVMAYLGIILVLCKTASALIYGIFLSTSVWMFRLRTQLRIALALALIGFSYPVLRSVDLFPDGTLVNIATAVDTERAQSLQFRFDQEATLLAHALERPLFGWGRYGRNRVYDEDSGADQSITDGLWIITVGQFGLIGFLLQFGLLTLPVYRAVSVWRSIAGRADGIFFSSLTLIVATRVVDQLPNSSLSPWVWLLAGALLGRSEALATRANLLAQVPSIVSRSPLSSKSRV